MRDRKRRIEVLENALARLYAQEFNDDAAEMQKDREVEEGDEPYTGADLLCSYLDNGMDEDLPWAKSILTKVCARLGVKPGPQ